MKKYTLFGNDVIGLRENITKEKSRLNKALTAYEKDSSSKEIAVLCREYFDNMRTQRDEFLESEDKPQETINFLTSDLYKMARALMGFHRMSNAFPTYQRGVNIMKKLCEYEKALDRALIDAL